ncbi:hypothetical protein H2O64_16150 [Kordia sp. YSTF-M3]|uniref:Bacteriocin n=1 Tax=Kordia aestuariivivens TaxID=2759037 RepID=A0ABR7QCA3_9FLAO|nr:hypothetical protein [Kordia aestuariivivens]MBC8756210.1 hypothetical protein [Kordia aestuariivivens]
MKKKNLKLLSFNKESISTLQFTDQIKGGSGGCQPSDIIPLCPRPDDTSANGCETVPTYETMTCANWSCACNK